MKEILLTKSAYDRVQTELDELILKRKDISEEIKKAREFGDLSENAEYHAARESQSLNETEILKRKEILENCKIIAEDEVDETRVSMNSKLEILYMDDNEMSEITIVSTIESDPFEGLVSNESPIGEALLGKTEGEEVEAMTPNGPLRIKILKIKH